MDYRTKDTREKLKGAESDAEKKELNDKIKRVEKGWFSKNIMHLMAFILNDQKNMDTDTPLNVYREYNVTTKLDTPSIEKVCKWMDVRVVEFDIRSCAWRIIYAILGLPFPDNFYGVNKKNKTKLNALLNQLSAPAEIKRRKGQFEDFKNRKKKQLKNRGVPARVYNWLVDNFAEKPSDTFTTLLIAIPSAVKAFNYITTLWKGNLQLNPAMLFSIGLVSTFITGGLTGIILGDSALDINVHDTYFVVAHFHLVMGISALYGLFAGVYHWFPKMFGRMLNKNLGYIHFWVTAVCA